MINLHFIDKFIDSARMREFGPYEILKEIVFWVITMIVLVFAFGQSNANYIQSFYFVTLLIPVIIGLIISLIIFSCPVICSEKDIGNLHYIAFTHL